MNFRSFGGLYVLILLIFFLLVLVNTQPKSKDVDKASHTGKTGQGDDSTVVKNKKDRSGDNADKQAESSSAAEKKKKHHHGHKKHKREKDTSSSTSGKTKKGRETKSDYSSYSTSSTSKDQKPITQLKPEEQQPEKGLVSTLNGGQATVLAVGGVMTAAGVLIGVVGGIKHHNKMKEFKKVQQNQKTPSAPPAEHIYQSLKKLNTENPYATLSKRTNSNRQETTDHKREKEGRGRSHARDDKEEEPKKRIKEVNVTARKEKEDQSGKRRKQESKGSRSRQWENNNGKSHFQEKKALPSPSSRPAHHRTMSRR